MNDQHDDLTPEEPTHAQKVAASINRKRAKAWDAFVRRLAEETRVKKDKEAGE